jgi:hypothetical protein
MSQTKKSIDCSLWITSCISNILTPQLHIIMVAKTIITALTSVLLFVDTSNAAACPFSDAHKAGLLDSDLAVKFEAAQKDPKNADRLIGAHYAGVKRQNPQQGEVAGLVGPIIDGVLNLPLGGGLCTSSCRF